MWGRELANRAYYKRDEICKIPYVARRVHKMSISVEKVRLCVGILPMCGGVMGWGGSRGGLWNMDFLGLANILVVVFCYGAELEGEGRLAISSGSFWRLRIMEKKEH